MIAVDTNLLVYAHRSDSPLHDMARETVGALAGGRDPWMIPWPCVHEFLAVATHPRIYKPPSTMAQALGQVDAWMESPTLMVEGDNGAAWARGRELLVAGRVAGPMVHDARVAAICLAHGVSELLTVDRDFSRFAGLTVRNPLSGWRARA